MAERSKLVPIDYASPPAQAKSGRGFVIVLVIAGIAGLLFGTLAPSVARYKVTAPPVTRPAL